MYKLICKIILILLTLSNVSLSFGQDIGQLRQFFATPPDRAKPRGYWWWLYNRVSKEAITRDLEEFKAKGISGVNLICTGGYAGDKALLGIKWLSPEWSSLYQHAVREAKLLSDLKNKWGRMRSVWENNTLQEFWVAHPDGGSQWSHCAMYPLIALNQGIAGIHPLEPGCKKIKIEPQIGDLESVNFNVQTTKGPIEFSSKGKKGNRVIHLQIPKSMEVELWLDKREEVNLSLLRMEDSGICVYKIVNPGVYNLKLKHT